ncbi:hypothetical protein [Conexibacter sp. SYSU D00693]|uniref:hypothetical protein n=1 Tax=Conexibacter sp. SYSU D00693 TaxID=2812560 RepID=UPI00196AC28D|nr:hypothetical protein [Conexibacter sp. SYSU D00693]
MDPRGAAPLGASDPAGGLDRLAERSADGFPALTAARARTADGLADRRRALGAVDLPDDLAVVLFGSWGRHEVTAGSDDDWALLRGGEPDEADRPAHGTQALPGLTPPPLAAVGAVLGGPGRDPGQQGTFASTIGVDALVERIGLDADDNRNLTRRMLLVLESVAVVGEGVHAAARAQVVDAYLADASASFRPPRFFLNDLIRYWRTICVDFVGKLRGPGDAKWGLRNAKLRTSRKVLFAGGLLPLLACHRLPRERHRDHLLAQLAAPPTDRIAQAFLDHGAADAGVRALAAYDRWVALLGDDDARQELAQLREADARTSPAFRDARRHAAELQGGLLALLFETPLRDVVREYGIF